MGNSTILKVSRKISFQNHFKRYTSLVKRALKGKPRTICLLFLLSLIDSVGNSFNIPLVITDLLFTIFIILG